MSASFLTKRWVVVLLASLCCLLWGSAYPAIKNGYVLFNIVATDIPSKMVFAGFRFAFAGLLLLVLSAVVGKSGDKPGDKPGDKGIFRLTLREFGQVSLLGLTQTAIQYVFFYVGLAYTTGVKGSIMNATGTFFSVLLAHFIYHNDRLNAYRIAGCLIGFVGVMVVNFKPELMDFSFTFLGEGFVVIAAFILAAASIYGKSISQHMDSVLMTGWQLFIGGVVLLLVGYAFGGMLDGFTWASSALLAYLVVLSSAAFALWSLLLKYNRVGIVTVFNFLVPIFGAVLSAIFLDESVLEWKNAVALVLVCGGIWLVTQEKA